MRHRKYTFKLGRSSAHRRAMLANMACSLIYTNEIKTTLPKAKAARRFIEKLVTLAKKAYATDEKAKKVHYVRLAVAKIKDKEAVKYLFDDIAPKFAERNGGYTRIIKIGKFRHGDAAELCILQWVNEEIAVEDENKETVKENSEEGKVKGEATEATDTVTEKEEEKKEEEKLEKTVTEQQNFENETNQQKEE